MEPHQNGTRALARATAVVAAALVVASFVAAPAAAAGETTVRLVPGSEQVPVEQTTTVAVVVTDVDGGVGALNVTVSADGNATITNASVGGGAGLSRVTVAPDGTAARVVAAIMDTPDRGSTTVATVTVAGRVDGASDLSVRVDELADESGSSYRVTGTQGASLVVGSGPSTATARAATDGSGSADEGDAVSGSESASGSAHDGADDTASGAVDRPEAGAALAPLGPLVGSPALLALALLAAVGIGVAVGRRG